MSKSNSEQTPINPNGYEYGVGYNYNDQSSISIQTQSPISMETELGEQLMNCQMENERKDRIISIQQQQIDILEVDYKDYYYLKVLYTWKWDNVYQWIMSQNNGLYSRYDPQLRQSLEEENVDGQCLEYLANEDCDGSLKRFGITSQQDRAWLKWRLKIFITPSKH